MWEYLTVNLQGIEENAVFGVRTKWDAGYFTQQINYYAQQGWELVSQFDTIMSLGQSSTTSGVFATFKRKIES